MNDPFEVSFSAVAIDDFHHTSFVAGVDTVDTFNPLSSRPVRTFPRTGVRIAPSMLTMKLERLTVMAVEE